MHVLKYSMIITLQHAYKRHTQCTKIQPSRNSNPHSLHRACFVDTNPAQFTSDPMLDNLWLLLSQAQSILYYFMSCADFQCHQ